MLSIANRQSTQLRHTVGWLAGKAVIVSRPGGAASGVELLAEVNNATFTALDNGDVPWPCLAAYLEPDLMGRHAPRPYISINLSPPSMNRILPPDVFAGCASARIPLSVASPDAAIAIGVTMTDSPQGIVSLNYKTDWYEKAAVQRFWETVERRLQSLVGEALTGV
jgi:hypothetical protein